MKAADAKNPKFDAAWWKKNKAVAADVMGKFEKLLKQYEVLRANATTAAGKTAASDVPEQAVKVLTALMKEARSTDLKLGPAQKETKEARENYAKECEKAIKGIAKMKQACAGLPSVPQLLNDKLFVEFSKKLYADENVEYLVALKAKMPPEKIYKDIIPRLNIDDLQRDFDRIARAIKDGTEADPKAAWAKAPWKETAQIVSDLLNADTVPKYRAWRVVHELPKWLPA